MPYAYYSRLDAKQKAIYRRSDAVAAIRLPRPSAFRPMVRALADALTTGQPAEVRRAAQGLTDALLAALGVRRVHVKVLSKRPSTKVTELHGLYDPGDRRTPPTVTVWMRTAAQRRVVAFRTFLRTLLHELCHHLDYELLELADSFHTQGFFKREASLTKQLAGPGKRKRR